MTIKECCALLDNQPGLWRITRLDWDLTISYCFTEPTCPTVIIRPEGTNITRYSHHCDTDKIEETVEKLCKLVYAEIVEGKLLGRGNTPFTNSDDRILEEWLNKRQEDKELEFPYNKFYEVLNKRLQNKMKE